jgi:hypothetical protein
MRTHEKIWPATIAGAAGAATLLLERFRRRQKIGY